MANALYASMHGMIYERLTLFCLINYQDIPFALLYLWLGDYGTRFVGFLISFVEIFQIQLTCNVSSMFVSYFFFIFFFAWWSAGIEHATQVY